MKQSAQQVRAMQAVNQHPEMPQLVASIEDLEPNSGAELSLP